MDKLSNPLDGAPKGTADTTNVIEFAAAARARQIEPYFTDEERRELREMMMWVRTVRPGLLAGCPTFRRLFSDD